MIQMETLSEELRLEFGGDVQAEEKKKEVISVLWC